MTKVQALGCREDMPLTIKVQGQDVTVVEEFVYLGSQWCLHMLLGIKFGTNLYGMMMYGG